MITFWSWFFKSVEEWFGSSIATSKPTGCLSPRPPLRQISGQANYK